MDSLPARMVRKIDASGECWTWVGAVTSRGYGSFGYEGRIWSTHRLAYELLVGAIPAGLTIDHLCRNKLCCNPAHLEPVTLAENLRRARMSQFYPPSPAPENPGALRAIFDAYFPAHAALPSYEPAS
jgi:hypothetical protein